MRFSAQDVARFATWSHDRDPLHADPEFSKGTYFGGTIVHGMLSVLAAIREGLPPQWTVPALDVEFKGAVRRRECCDDTKHFTRTSPGKPACNNCRSLRPWGARRRDVRQMRNAHRMGEAQRA